MRLLLVSTGLCLGAAWVVPAVLLLDALGGEAFESPAWARLIAMLHGATATAGMVCCALPVSLMTARRGWSVGKASALTILSGSVGAALLGFLLWHGRTSSLLQPLVATALLAMLESATFWAVIHRGRPIQA